MPLAKCASHLGSTDFDMSFDQYIIARPCGLMEGQHSSKVFYAGSSPARGAKEITMESLKDYLLNKKKNIELQLNPYYSLIKELEVIDSALRTIKESTCTIYYCSGCYFCRKGSYYR